MAAKKHKHEVLREGEYLLGLQEAASVLGASRSTIYRLIGKGELPVVYLGRSLRFWSHDVRALIYTRIQPARRRARRRSRKRK